MLTGISGLVLGVALIAGLLWQLSVRQLARESNLVETAAGPVEYAASGDPRDASVLFVHGSPGGYDQLLPLARRVSRRGYRAVTVSRPGYLRTPQSAGRTPEEHADVLAATVEVLDLGPVVVAGVSGGGPSTLQLALRHPELVHGVVLICAVTLRDPEGQPRPEDVRTFGLDWDLGALAARWSPSIALGLLGIDDPDERRRLLADEETTESVRYLFQSMGFSSRRTGYRTDMLSLATDNRSPPLSSLETPVLLLHGSDDPNVPLEHSQYVASQAPHADLRVLDGAGHTFFVLRRAWLDEQLFDFLEAVTN